MVLHATPRRKVAYAQLEHPQRPSRRAVLTSVGLPMLLAPTQAAWAGEGRLSIDEVESRLRRCFEEGQYYVSGKLDRGIFEPDCFFKDPTVSVKGTEKYADAVASIFSPETARADIVKCNITGPRTIELDWRLAGVITQGGVSFRFKPYTGSTVYTTSVESGKIERQDESWDISRLDVFVSLFFPKFGAPPAPPIEELRARVTRY